MSNLSSLKIALFAGAFGLALAGSANAQDNGRSGPPGNVEQVQVTAPHFRTDHMRLNGPLEPVSMSTLVRFDDLDLRTRAGARELRFRVRDAARGICGQLANVYPVYEASGTSCFKAAREDALLRANRAIRDAREYRL